MSREGIKQIFFGTCTDKWASSGNIKKMGPVQQYQHFKGTLWGNRKELKIIGGWLTGCACDQVCGQRSSGPSDGDDKVGNTRQTSGAWLRQHHRRHSWLPSGTSARGARSFCRRHVAGFWITRVFRLNDSDHGARVHRPN